MDNKVMIIGHCDSGKSQIIKKLLEENSFNVVENISLKELRENQVDLKPELASCINDNFWELF